VNIGRRAKGVKGRYRLIDSLLKLDCQSEKISENALSCESSAPLFLFVFAMIVFMIVFGTQSLCLMRTFHNDLIVDARYLKAITGARSHR